MRKYERVEMIRCDLAPWNGHSVSTSSTVAPHARQRGGNTPLTTARPRRGKRDGSVATSCIAAHH
jgi:hypothetical protein